MAEINGVDDGILIFELLLNKTFDYSGSLSYINKKARRTEEIVYFQALDDKKECVGIYHDGRLNFDEDTFPDCLSSMRTWKYSGFLQDDSIEYGWMRTGGKTLKNSCPENLIGELVRFEKKNECV